jgi:two-component system sensor histidine kinase UhpB
MRSRWNATSLFWRVFGINASVLVTAGLILVLTPATVSTPVKAEQVVVLALGVALLLAADLVLLRRALRPVGALIADMQRVDLLQPGRRIVADGPSRELIDLATGFNEMLDRLEHERQVAVTAVYDAIDEERRRIAADLHDQVGQDLTALLMQLDRATRGGDDVARARELTREVLETVRHIAFQLRPDPLEELGLVEALDSMCARLAKLTGLTINADVAPDVPALGEHTELAVYRIAQEAMTNAIRHAGAASITASLHPAEHPWAALLTVRDDGTSPLPPGDEGLGLRVIRERALTISGRVTISHVDGRGTEVHLQVPALDTA